jgi:hypothetical protein
MEMEFILFRLIQLMKRELLVLDEIQACFANPQRVSPEQNEKMVKNCTRHPEQLIHEIQQLELDKKEECRTIAKKLNLPLADWTLCRLLIEYNQMMDRSNNLLIALYNDLMALIKSARFKTHSLQQVLKQYLPPTTPSKASMLPDLNSYPTFSLSPNPPSPTSIKKPVRINMN